MTNGTLNPIPGLTQPSPDIFQKYNFFGDVTEYSPLASSIYHAGSISFTQNSRHGLTLNANYTYAHTIDNATNEFHTSALNSRRAQDNFNLAADRANSDLDVPQKFALSILYQLVKANLDNAFANLHTHCAQRILSVCKPEASKPDFGRSAECYGRGW